MSTEIRFDSDPSGQRVLPNWPVTNQVAMTDVAAEIVANRGSRNSVTIQNLDTTNNLFIGNEDVSASNGFRLKPAESIEIQTGHAVYGICSSGQTATAGVLENVL